MADNCKGSNFLKQACTDGASGPQGPAGPTGPAASPVGSDTYLQFNEASSFGASSDLVFDYSSAFLGIGTTVPTAALEVSGGSVIVAGADGDASAITLSSNKSTEYLSLVNWDLRGTRQVVMGWGQNGGAQGDFQLGLLEGNDFIITGGNVCINPNREGLGPYYNSIPSVSGLSVWGDISGTSGWISNAYLGTGLVGSPDLPLTIKSQGGYTTDSSWNSMAIQGSNPSSTYYTTYFGEDAGGSGYLKIGSAGHPGNLMLSGNSISFEERAVADSAPPATAGFGQIYTKDDQALYFLDGAGVEYTISITPVV